MHDRINLPPEPPNHNCDCIDCGLSSREYGVYMATDEVWEAAGLKYRDNVCRPCLSKRLGRPLAAADFACVHANFQSVPEFFPPSRLPEADAEWRKLVAEVEEYCRQSQNP
jgi:hypothetical protein